MDNVYQRIFNIISLIREREEGTGISVNEISEVLNIPRYIVLKDLKKIQENRLFGIDIVCADIENDNENFTEELFEQLHNDEPISAALVNETDCLLTLNSIEMIFLKKYLGMSKKWNDEDFVIKQLYDKDFADCEFFSDILEAIRKNEIMNMRYHTKSGKNINVQIKPVTIVKFVDSKIYYLVAVEQDKIWYYRLDRIKGTDNIQKKYSLSNEEKNLLKRFEYQWGMETDKEPVEIKLRVTKEANVYSKMMSELFYRKHGKWYEEQEYYYYTDKILGINSFKAWLRKYGRAAMVVEPRWLAKEIYEAALLKRKIYEEDKVL